MTEMTTESHPQGVLPQGGIPATVKELLHRHEALIRELETLGDRTVADFSGEIGRLKSDYRALPEPPPEYDEILEKRFLAAVELADKARAANDEKLKAVEARRAEAEKLSGELDRCLANAELLMLTEVEQLEQRFEANAAQGDVDSALLDSFRERLAPLKAELAREAEAETLRAAEAMRLADELAELVKGEDIQILQTRKPEIEAAYAALERVPKKAADHYQRVHKTAAGRLAQHYETLDFARWESYTLKLELCKELDRLQELPDAELPKIATQLRQLRDKWKTLGKEPKAKSEEINGRYLEATRKLQHRVDEFYAHRRQEQKQAAEGKKALIERAAELAPSTEWKATAELFKQLQEEWKTLPSAGPNEKALFAAFREAADQFFNARSLFLGERNKKLDEAAAAKAALVAEAEALGQDEAAGRRARQLRGEFQAIPSAGRQEHELFTRFNTALDRFFSGRREAFAEKETKSAELVAEIRKLAETMEDPEAARSRVREIREELRRLACRNTFAAEKSAFEAFDAAFAAANQRLLGDKLTVYREAARPLAAAWAKVKAGEAFDEEGLDQAAIARFGKLRQTLELLRVAGGDEKARRKLEKWEANAEMEHERINSELEKLVGLDAEATGAPKALSLAEELQLAIAGNFGGGFSKAPAAVSSRPADPAQLLSDYLNAGLLGPEALEHSFARFDRANARIK